MERRKFLKAVFGLASGVVGAAALAATAQASPLIQPVQPGDDARTPQPPAQPAVGTQEDLDAAVPEQVRWRYRRRRVYFYRRPRYYIVRRRRRRIYYW